MKKIFLSVIVFLLGFSIAFSQTESQQSIDLIQRQMMKDSLQISDATVSQIFAIRDNMITQIIGIRKDSLLTEADKETQIASIRTRTNNSIKQALGDRKFQLYIDMIRRWVSKRTGQNTDPLASGN